NGNTTGTGVPHVKSTLFFYLQIPYRPIDKQIEAVADLQRKIKEIDFAFENQKNLIRKTFLHTPIGFADEENLNKSIRNFRQAVIQKGISGDLTKKWRSSNGVKLKNVKVPLETVIKQIKSGKSFRCLERPPKKNEIGVLKISAVSYSE